MRIAIRVVVACALSGFLLTHQSTAEALDVVSDSSDIAVVQAILDSNNLHRICADSVVTIENDRVVRLDLANPRATGPYLLKVPAMIAKLTHLRELRLGCNSLRSLPVEIGELRSLRVLDLRSNKLRDLPNSVAELDSLESLDLRYNGLTVLPPVCLRLTSLRKLHLWGNELVTLPEEISNLSALREVYLRYNRLTSLPVAVLAMGNIVYIDVAFNQLCSLPPDLDAWVSRRIAGYKSMQRCR